MDISVVDLNRVEVYEAGASLITLLAYPRERDEGYGPRFTRPSATMRSE